MSLASSSMDASTYWGSSASHVGLPSGRCAKEASNEWPMARASDIAMWEPTATLDFHPSSVGSGMGYRKRGDLGGLADGGGQSLRGRDREVNGAHDPLVVQKSGLDRHYVFRLARDAPGVPYSEMVNT